MAASTQADLLGNRYGHLAYRRRVITHSTASTATYNVSPRESGAIFVVPVVSTAKFALPKISSLALGLNYEFLVTKPSSALDVTIASTIDSSAQMICLPGTTGTTQSTASAISPGSTIGAFYHAKLTAVSSVNWLVEDIKTIESSGSDLVGALVYNDWALGTTSA